jgi:hypothetical protein
MTPPVGPSASTAGAAAETGSRPRVEGDREQQILDATLDVLADVGYDRLTMDAVAAAARASKATLYRRWSTKQALVIDSLCSMKEPHELPHTGSLRGDLVGMFCGMGGLTDERQMAVLASVITAIGRDQDFAAAFRDQFIGPKAEASAVVWERAAERGEIAEGVDLDLLMSALPGIVLHRAFLLGEEPTPEYIERVIDHLILPAVVAGPHDHTTCTSRTNTDKDHA